MRIEFYLSSHFEADANLLPELASEEIEGRLLSVLNAATDNCLRSPVSVEHPDFPAFQASALKRAASRIFRAESVRFRPRMGAEPDPPWIAVMRIMEAFGALCSAGLVAPWFDGDEETWFVAARGRSIRSADDWRHFWAASSFPRGELAPAIRADAWPPFLRGKYAEAIFAAVRRLEVTTRLAYEAVTGAPTTRYGVDLMRKAFDATDGPLRDENLQPPESEAMAHLFAGIVGAYKNLHSHRSVEAGVVEAVEVIPFASRLYRIVVARAAAREVDPARLAGDGGA